MAKMGEAHCKDGWWKAQNKNGRSIDRPGITNLGRGWVFLSFIMARVMIQPCYLSSPHPLPRITVSRGPLIVSFASLAEVSSSFEEKIPARLGYHATHRILSTISWSA
jgi:hypothetical protein